ncbi:MAG: glycosyltransferase [Armatimonadetes bacterium]|nr:glycosyltransferase [Armatimonadota bacterium]
MRVSVLLTCYNHLRHLQLAYQSLLDQTFTEFEIIALDDGSTDGTREWLSAQTDPRLRLIFNETNLGTYATLNVGLREAKGEFIAVLNDDDLWAPEKLAQQVQYLDANPKAGLVHCGGWFIDGDGRRHPDPAPLGFPYPRTESGDILAAEIDHNQIIASSVLFRAPIVDSIGPFDPAYFGSGDWQMWLRIARVADIGYLDEPLCFYRVHGANASHQKEKIFRDDARIREWIATWEGDASLLARPGVKAALAHNRACLGTVYAWTGEVKKGRANYWKSWRMMPSRMKSLARWVLSFLPAKTFRRLG